MSKPLSYPKPNLRRRKTAPMARKRAFRLALYPPQPVPTRKLPIVLSLFPFTSATTH